MEKKKIAAAGILLILACILAGVLYFCLRPQPSEGMKHISVTVVHGNGEEKVFPYDTDAAYLGELLEADGLISGEDGEMVNTSVDTTPIEDGDEFELTLKEGY